MEIEIDSTGYLEKINRSNGPEAVGFSGYERYRITLYSNSLKQHVVAIDPNGNVSLYSGFISLSSPWEIRTL